MFEKDTRHHGGRGYGYGHGSGGRRRRSRRRGAPSTYEPLRVDLASHGRAVIDIVHVEREAAEDGELLFTIYGTDRLEKIRFRLSGGTTVIRLDEQDIREILNQAPRHVGEAGDSPGTECQFVIEYKISVADLDTKQDTLLRTGPLIIGVDCGDGDGDGRRRSGSGDWAIYSNGTAPAVHARYGVVGQFEPGESGAIPYRAGKNYAKGTLVEGPGGSVYMAICNNPQGAPQAGAPATGADEVQIGEGLDSVSVESVTAPYAGDGDGAQAGDGS